MRVRDAARRQKLAQYMLRAPFSLEKMCYDDRRKSLWDEHTGMVLYRSHMHKGLKRNYQLMPGAQWLELLCSHIPDRFEQLVRYTGWYSNRVRGERARRSAVDLGAADLQSLCSGCSRMPALQRPDEGDRLERRTRCDTPNTQASSPVVAGCKIQTGARAAKRGAWRSRHGCKCSTQLPPGS